MCYCLDVEKNSMIIILKVTPRIHIRESCGIYRLLVRNHRKQPTRISIWQRMGIICRIGIVFDLYRGLC